MPPSPLGSTDAALRAFTRSGDPHPTLALVLAAVTVATVAMDVDAIARYSPSAFFVGLGLTALLAAVAGTILGRLGSARSARMLVAAFLPSMFGAAIGMVVQAIVLHDLDKSRMYGIKDLGGLVDTNTPVLWIASGVVLGGLPAIAVTIFAILAARALDRISGHDAADHFSVMYTGVAGLAAGGALLVVDRFAATPLVVVAAVAVLALLVTVIVDTSRAAFLRKVYAGKDGAFDIVPAERFAGDPSLAPIVGAAGRAAVLVRVDTRGSYRGAAAEPVALLGETEAATLRPLRRRRLAALCMVLATVTLGGLAAANIVL